ncbi:hypothetical protein A4G28_23580 [Mycobacterium ostraviense]|uniref:Uncharacterized protein n=1 Tax=Mycobacterium ostraviense TaxID=2738409 RepID=A0A162D3B2_9MYCO|nr:hypothetical protein A4G28_23580 [Mycobacterium ostraviense]
MPICTLADMQACFSLLQLVVGASCCCSDRLPRSPVFPLTQGVVGETAAAGVAKTLAIGQSRTVASASRATGLKDISDSSRENVRGFRIAPVVLSG